MRFRGFHRRVVFSVLLLYCAARLFVKPSQGGVGVVALPDNWTASGMAGDALPWVCGACVMDPLDYPDAYCSSQPAARFNGSVLRPSLRDLDSLEHRYDGRSTPEGSPMSDVLDLISTSLRHTPVFGILGDSFMQQARDI